MSSKQYPVIDAQSAIKKHNENLQGFKEIQARMNTVKINDLPPVEDEPTLDDYLAENGLPQTFSVKASLAKQVGISSYMGKPEQDKQILRAITVLNSKKAEEEGKKRESEDKEREYGFKEKELALKEKEVESKKMPGADEIASSLMNKFNQ